MKPIRLLLFSITLLTILSCSNKEKFETLKWKNWTESESNPNLRWQMHEDLLKNYTLNGYTKKQIVDLLGNPNKENNDEYYYSLGYADNGIDTGTLVIKFKNDIVINIDVLRG